MVLWLLASPWVQVNPGYSCNSASSCGDKTKRRGRWA